MIQMYYNGNHQISFALAIRHARALLLARLTLSNIKFKSRCSLIQRPRYLYSLQHSKELPLNLKSDFDCTLLFGYWASVSEPHTCDFNATFSLYVCYISTIIYIYATVTVLLTLRSIFHLGLIRGARAYGPDAARRGAVGPTHC